MKIVIVEDDALIALFIASTLEELGHKVLGQFSDAVSVLDFVKENAVDLALMDIEIEGSVDGLQCAKTLKIKHNIPSIFVTSHKESEVIQEAMEVEPLGFLIKPIEESDIEAALALASRYFKDDEKPSKTVVNAYEYNFEFKTLKYQGEIVKLGKNELKLIHILFKNLNNTVSTEEIMSFIWDEVLESDESLRQLIYRTRKKVPALEIVSSSKMGYAIST